MTIPNPAAALGEAFRPIGRWAFLLIDGFASPRQLPQYRWHLFRQMVEIGIVVPRVIAGTLTLPILYVGACFVALAAAVLTASMSGIVPVQTFLKGARSYFETYDVFYGMIKASVFGFLLTSIACYKGLPADYPF